MQEYTLKEISSLTPKERAILLAEDVSSSNLGYGQILDQKIFNKILQDFALNEKEKDVYLKIRDFEKKIARVAALLKVKLQLMFERRTQYKLLLSYQLLCTETKKRELEEANIVIINETKLRLKKVITQIKIIIDFINSEMTDSRIKIEPYKKYTNDAIKLCLETLFLLENEFKKSETEAKKIYKILKDEPYEKFIKENLMNLRLYESIILDDDL